MKGAARVAASFCIMFGALLSGPQTASATSHFVDAAVRHSGDGSTWRLAWKTFGNINWARVSPGDTIFVSGGRSGTSYFEPLVVGASGTAINPITVTVGRDFGHDGGVTIDGRDRINTCVIINHRDHILVQGLVIRNCTETAVQVRFSRGAVVSGNIIFALSRGFHIWKTRNVKILQNVVGTPSWINRQTDGIYSQENVSNTYGWNRIVISNSEPTGHDDGIQSYLDKDITIIGNYIEQKNSKTGNAQGIYINEASGIMNAINNVVYGPNTRNGLITLLNERGARGALHAYNNTLVGSRWGIVQLQNSPDSEIINNILLSSSANAAGIAIVGSLPRVGSIDYNIYRLPLGTPGYLPALGRAYTWPLWRLLGYERHGIVGDPKLQSILLRKFNLTPGSPAIDAGRTLIAVTTDFAHRRRPVGRSADIGAYEGISP